ncbi:MAG: S9 family peptidase, partial [Candidatus Margulisbacteria bacterium]|nr:S9 family peptidase [Candidatus Margulisiibacteriota bacterium]
MAKMRSAFFVLLFCGLILICFLGFILWEWLGQSPKIPLRDFFRNPEKAAYQLSQDGKTISYLAPYRKRLNIFVRPTAGGAAKRITNVVDRDISAYSWKGSDYLLYMRDYGGDENFHLYVVNKDGSGEKELTPFPGVRVRLIDDLYDDPDWVIIGMNKRNPEIFDAFRLNIKTGEIKLVAENPGNIADWLTDHDGQIRVAVTGDGLDSTVLYRDSEAEPFRPLLTFGYHDTFAPLFFTFDNKQLYAASNLGRDKIAIVKYDPASQKEVELLFQHPEVDVDGLNYSRKRKALTTIVYETWKEERRFLDSTAEGIYSDLAAQLPGYEIDVTGNNRDEDLFIVRTTSDRSRGAYYLYELAGQRLTKLAEAAPWLKESDLAEMKPIEYMSRDGLKINAYLVVP